MIQYNKGWIHRKIFSETLNQSHDGISLIYNEKRHLDSVKLAAEWGMNCAKNEGTSDGEVQEAVKQKNERPSKDRECMGSISQLATDLYILSSTSRGKSISVRR